MSSAAIESAGKDVMDAIMAFAAAIQQPPVANPFDDNPFDDAPRAPVRGQVPVPLRRQLLSAAERLQLILNKEEPNSQVSREPEVTRVMEEDLGRVRSESNAHNAFGETEKTKPKLSDREALRKAKEDAARAAVGLPPKKTKGERSPRRASPRKTSDEQSAVVGGAGLTHVDDSDVYLSKARFQNSDSD